MTREQEALAIVEALASRMVDDDPIYQPQIDIGQCPYNLKNGLRGEHGVNTCCFGCQDEPECETMQPVEGWLSERILAFNDPNYQPMEG